MNNFWGKISVLMKVKLKTEKEINQDGKKKETVGEVFSINKRKIAELVYL